MRCWLREALKVRVLPLVSKTRVWFGSAVLMKCDVNSWGHMVASDPQTNRNPKSVHVCQYFIHCGMIGNSR